MNEIKIKDIADIDRAAAEFVSLMGQNTVFAFYGTMGAGKTTFINAVCRRLGVDDDSTASPTFAIVNEYRGKDNRRIYHFDFYRIDSPEEALDFGVEDYFDSGDICFLEWPERIEPLLPDDVVRVDIFSAPDASRLVKF